MGDRFRSATFDDLPSHLILEILTSGARLGGVDLACLELTNSTFRATNLVDFAAFQLSRSHPIYVSLSNRAQEELLARCNGNWKKVLRFLQSVHQSSDIVETSSGNQMQIRSGRYHTLLIKDSTVYSCGSSLCGVLGHGPETTQCVAFTPIKFPYPVRVTHVSASHNHAAFVTNLGEVFTCGDNSSFCCGHGDTNRAIFKPRLVQSLKHIPCKQVAAGVSFTVFLTTEGQVYTCGTNSHGQLGHGDTLDRPTPKLIEPLGPGPVTQIAAGPGFTLAVTNDGTVYSCGSGSNFCLGHGEQHNELRPRVVQWFRRKGIFVVRVSAGDEHVVALDSNGFVTVHTMSSQGRSTGSSSQSDLSKPRKVQFRRCYCGLSAPFSTSWSDKNPRRRYFGCKYWPDSKEDCCFFEWYDDEVSEWYKEVLNQLVYTWGKGYCGALGHGDEIDKTVPALLSSLKNHLAVQVCASKRKTFVLLDNGSVYGFGWMGFGSLGFPDRGVSDKVLKPSMLYSLKDHHICQVSTGLYHSVVVTNRGRIFGFGDNERAQLAHDKLRVCLHPTEILVEGVSEDGGICL
ncbi:hypothetical protein LXL04_039871 [Taraxacum kok-saghyz]